MKGLQKAIFFFIILLQPCLLRGDFNDWCGDFCDNSLRCEEFSVELKYSAYFPLNSRVSKIYNDALPDFGIGIATRICCDWQPWFDIDYIWSNGKSIGCGNKTQLSVLPLSFGLNYILPVCDCVEAYLGGGAVYSFLRTEDHSPYVHEHVRKNAWGGIFKTGFYYHYTECVFFEGFFNYMYQRFNFSNSHSVEDEEFYVERNNVDFSGIKLGLAVGVRF